MPSNTSSPGPASHDGGQDPDRQTHSTHTINVPYRPTFHPKPEETPKEPPKVTPIPRITSPDSSKSSSVSPEGLEGKYVDEFGNILDWNGTVLGRVEGDLPSMVGRPVSKTGEVLDEDGEAVGYVSENYTKPPLKELDGGLRVDDAGNIYNQDGAVIGKLNEPPKREESTSGKGDSSRGAQHDSSSAPKPASAPNPSEIYLDVKSTYEGIQLIIKIPTIFNRDKEDEAKSQ